MSAGRLFSTEVTEWTGSESPGGARHTLLDTEVSPGRFQCRLAQRSGEPLHVDLGFPQLDESAIDDLVTVIVGDPATGAALITGRLPTVVAARLVPAAERWTGDCSCGEWVGVCPHQAAVAWRLSALVDTDPFVLFILRGSSRSEVEAAVRERRGDEDPSAGRRDRGVDAPEAAARTPAPLPRPAPLPWRASSMGDLLHPPVDSGIDAAALQSLVADAAARAVALLADEQGAALDLDVHEDLIRRAVADEGEGAVQNARLAERLGWRPEAAGAASAAWRVGGRAGLRAARYYWDAPAHELDEAARAASARRGVRTRVSRNVVSGAGFQLRLDRDRTWWRFAPDDELGWVLDSEGFEDPVDALEASPVERVSPRR